MYAAGGGDAREDQDPVERGRDIAHELCAEGEAAAEAAAEARQRHLAARLHPQRGGQAAGAGAGDARPHGAAAHGHRQLQCRRQCVRAGVDAAAQALRRGGR